MESKEDSSDDEQEEKTVPLSSKSSKKPQGGGGLTRREEKSNKPKDDLSKLLSEVTGRTDIAEDSEDEENIIDVLPSSSNKVLFLGALVDLPKHDLLLC